jgi:cytochrome c6
MNSRRYISKVWSGSFFYVQGVIAAVILLTLSLSGTVYAADTIKGGRLYASNCALCHGASGISVMPAAPNFARGEGMLRPDLSLLAAIRSGKNAMPAFQGMLTDRDIMDVIAYLRTLH